MGDGTKQKKFRIPKVGDKLKVLIPWFHDINEPKGVILTINRVEGRVFHTPASDGCSPWIFLYPDDFEEGGLEYVDPEFSVIPDDNSGLVGVNVPIENDNQNKLQNDHHEMLSLLSEAIDIINGITPEHKTWLRYARKLVGQK